MAFWSRSTKTMCIAAALLGLSATRLVTSVEAAPVTVFFDGTGAINGPGPHSGAIVFGGSFAYDTNWADSDPDPRVGVYNSPDPVYSFGLTWTYLDTNAFDPGIGFDTWNITIRDQPTGGTFADVFVTNGISSGLVNANAEVALLDFFSLSPDPTSILTDDLLFIPSFAQFFDTGFADVSRAACVAPATCEEVHWFGFIHRYEVVTDSIPLPAALPLFAGGLGVMGWLARRRKRDKAARQ